MPARPDRRSALLRLALCAGTIVAGSALLLPGGSSNAADEPPLQPVPEGHCNAASRPETDIQGRVPSSDYQSGRAQKGYTCNTSEISHFGDTGGFKVFRREVLEAIPLDRVRSRGYAFQIELTYRAIRRGFRVVELPIRFVDREVGGSKMSRAIVLEAIWKVPLLRAAALRGTL